MRRDNIQNSLWKCSKLDRQMENWAEEEGIVKVFGILLIKH